MTQEEKIRYIEFDKNVKNKIKDLSKQEAINYLKEWEFDIQMIDHWDKEHYMMIDVLHKHIKELER